jgi:YidC/Oxa1 family membrane protein insertase
MTGIWNSLLFHPLVNGLFFFYKIFGNLGVAIILLTILIRVVLIPLTSPSMKAAKKMADLGPELAKLKEKHKDDKQKFAQAQMSLYKEHGVNPAAGCLPQIVQLLVLITLYQAFSSVLVQNGSDVLHKLNTILYPILQLPADTHLNLSFWYLNLAKPDMIALPGLPKIPGVFLILAALTQFISSKMMLPQVKKAEKEAKKTPGKTDDIASSMQSQMTYLFPLMTILIGFSFPSGLVLYWFIFSFSSIIQQYFVSGWGGLTPWIEKIRIKK